MFRFQGYHRWLRFLSFQSQTKYSSILDNIANFKYSTSSRYLVSKDISKGILLNDVKLFKNLNNNRNILFKLENQYHDNATYFKNLNLRKLVLLFSGGISICLIYEFIKGSSDLNKYCKNFHSYVSLSAATPIFKPHEDLNNEKEKGDKPPSGNRNKYNFIADVVDKVSDGVVFIEIKDHRRRDMHGNTLAMSNGSGFIVDSEGLILTNAHVVANKPRASTIMVRLNDGKEFEGKIEDFDSLSDLALIRIKYNGLTPLSLGSSKDVRPGEFVVALGSPLSLSNTITSGVVSSIGRASKDLGLRGKDIQYIQTDAAITFGNSGGPLVNLDGEVIAINSMKVTSGISFAIPIDYAKEFLEKVEKKKSFLSKYKREEGAESVSRRRYLGITMLSLTPEVISQMQQRSPESIIPPNVSHGILVWRLVVGSPAYHAGLEPGDIVTHINGHEINSSRDVYKMLEAKSDLQMIVNRKGERYSVTVTPEE